jgi:hypothetical protein
MTSEDSEEGEKVIEALWGEGLEEAVEKVLKEGLKEGGEELTVWLTLVGNLVGGYEMEFGQMVMEGWIYEGMRDILKEVIEGDRDVKGMVEIISTVNWFIYVVAEVFEDFPMAVTATIFDYYLSMMKCILLDEEKEAIIEVKDEFAKIMTYWIQGIRWIIKTKEWNQIEFAGNDELLKYTMTVIREWMKSKDRHPEIISAGCQIIETISWIDYHKKYLDWKVYETLFDLLFIVNASKDLANLVIALDNYSKLCYAVLKSLIDLDIIIFIANKATESLSPNLKYQTIYLFSELILALSDNEQWQKLIFFNRSMIECFTKLLQDVIENYSSNANLYSLALSLIDDLMSNEQNYYEKESKSEGSAPWKYKQIFIEKNLIENLESNYEASDVIRDKINEILVTHELSEAEDLEEFALEVNKKVYDSSLEF